MENSPRPERSREAAQSKDRGRDAGERPLTKDEFRERTGVSRETVARLGAYLDLLRAWNRRINLVGPRSLEDAWRRHILDCAQLGPLIPPAARVLVDLGSGAGLPGLVLAILGVPEVHLVESDTRKCAFLREAARICAAPVTVHAKRIGDVVPFATDIVTARALAPLDLLLDHAEKFCTPHSILLFLKGEGVQEELTRARKQWKMREALLPSASDPSGVILRLEGVLRAGDSGDDRTGRG
jgi:16S rRNA (guanine527-N7)-methyltransferase